MGRRSPPQKKKYAGVLCTCNMVPRADVEKAIARGCHRMEQIFTATTAGVGQCGGSCRPEIEKILNEYLKTVSSRSDDT